MHAERVTPFVQTVSSLLRPPSREGVTPHAIIHRDHQAVVRYFAPKDNQALRAPIFISMPLINTWTIWDLLPGRSVVARLTALGAPVYLLDWGRPGPEDAQTTIEDLIDGVLRRSMDRARRHAGVSEGGLDALGYCVGGTFLAVGLSRFPQLARRAAFVATPINFHEAGRLGAQIREETFPVDQLVGALGNYPGGMIKGGFVLLKPTQEIGKFVTLWERSEDVRFRELWAAMEGWASDVVDFPGEAYRQYVRACYMHNQLMTGGWFVGGQPVDLKRATLPATAIAASKDHIVPPASAHALASVWGGPVDTVTVEGGHVGMCVGNALPAALTRWVEAGG